MAIADIFNRAELIELFSHLDALRASGFVNMYGAGTCLEWKFGLDEDVARQVLTAWMRTADRKVQAADRVDQLIQAS